MDTSHSVRPVNDVKGIFLCGGCVFNLINLKFAESLKFT